MHIHTYINTYTYRNCKELDVDSPLHQTFPRPRPILVLLYAHQSRPVVSSQVRGLQIPKHTNIGSALTLVRRAL